MWVYAQYHPRDKCLLTRCLVLCPRDLCVDRCERRLLQSSHHWNLRSCEDRSYNPLCGISRRSHRPPNPPSHWGDSPRYCNALSSVVPSLRGYEHRICRRNPGGRYCRYSLDLHIRIWMVLRTLGCMLCGCGRGVSHENCKSPPRLPQSFWICGYLLTGYSDLSACRFVSSSTGLSTTVLRGQHPI